MVQHTVAKTAARAAVTGAMIGLWVATGPIAAQGANEFAVRAKVTQFIKEIEKETSEFDPGGKVQVSTRFVDLNADGTPEALVIVRTPHGCGSRGCEAYVLDLRGPAARIIGEYIGNKLEALPSRTGGWRDILLDGRRRIRFRGGQYGP